MKKILIIILLIPILGISQNFTNKFKTDSLEYRIDSTNTLLSQFTFASCGVSIPSNFLGYKFDNSIDLACTGNSPSSTEVCDFQHCTQSTPLTCIAMNNQNAMQSYINSTLIPDLNTCFGTSLVANDIIYIYNSALDEVEVWYNPTLIAINPQPHNFVISPIGTNSACEKPFPSIPIASSSIVSGDNALLVKLCEPLNISDTTHQSIFNEINNNIQNIYNIINTSSSLVGSNATTINLHTTTTAISISNVLEIIVENIGSTNTTITYGGVSITLNAGQQRLFTSVYDEGVKRYTPIPSLTVVGTASSPIVVTRKVFQ